MSETDDRHETRDVPVRLPLQVIAFTIVFVPLCAWLVSLLLDTAWRAPVQPPPVFEAEAERPGAAPPLQRAPPLDMERLDRRQEARLNGTGWVDRERGVVHLPIDRAMDLLVERGLPERAGPRTPRESLERGRAPESSP